MIACGGVSGSSATRYGSGPRAIATSPAPSRCTSPPSETTQALPRTIAISVSGASSSIRSDHGGSIVERSRKAPRARGPSSSPATASIPAKLRRSRMKSRDSAMDRPRDPYFNAGMSTHTLVLGGTGKTGRRVVERLRAKGVAVRVGSRSLPFDWNDDSHLGRRARRRLRGLRLLLPGPRDRGCARGRSARSRGWRPKRGVERLVLLSGRGEPEAQRAEQELIAAGTEWTVVRCSWFAQNFSEAFMRDGVLAGELAVPAGEIPEPFVDVEDIAEVADARADRGRPPRRRSTSSPGRARCASTRRPRRSPRPPAARCGSCPSRSTRSRPGCSRPASPRTRPRSSAFLFTEVLDGRNAQPQDGVQRALGRAPRDFGEYARTTAASGAWS